MVFHRAPCLTWLIRKATLSTTVQCRESLATKRHLKVAIVGSPNAGKSTLLNRLVMSEISCVSNKVHTTRYNILGVYTQDDTQIEFYDSPGLVTREHVIKHNLEESLLVDPKQASTHCDLIAVLVDASNIREKKRLNQGVMSILYSNRDKPSVLILNKVDLVKSKRELLEISTRLTQGCIDGKLQFSQEELGKMSRLDIIHLNLTSHVPGFEGEFQLKPMRRPHQFVIDMEPNVSRSYSEQYNVKLHPDKMSYKHFSQIFSVSALNNDGVDTLRNNLMNQATPVDELPHNADYLTNQSTRSIVHEIIRGQVMDQASKTMPYLLNYRYDVCEYDELGALHVNLLIRCPKKYMAPLLVGENGQILFKIIDNSREILSRTFKCDVKCTINVEYSANIKV